MINLDIHLESWTISTDEEADCYDAGFAGKYDENRADECETSE